MAKRNKSWQQRQARDTYVRQARGSHYRARSVFKLSEIDAKDKLFRSAKLVLDIGASPGGWSQYASERVGSQGSVIAVDILPINPISGVKVIQGDIEDQAVVTECHRLLDGRRVDLVLSDIAPNLSGVKSTDQARSIMLAELVLAFAEDFLSKDGTMLVKLFQGEGVDRYKRQLTEKFQRVMVRKPKASRSQSREFYVLAKGYRL